MSIMAPENVVSVQRTETNLSSQLETAQVHKASKALLKHLKASPKSKNPKSQTQDLLEVDSPAEEPIWLILTTKKHIVPQKKLKPSKIPLPHSLHTSPDLSICLITPDPQRSFKDAIADSDFPEALSGRIKRVIDVKKLEKKYHSFESKRLLMESYDLFLADDRIITYLVKILGKTFYNNSSKRPIPIRLQPSKTKEEKEKQKKKNAALPSAKPKKETPDLTSIILPLQMAREIEKTLSTTTVNLSSSATTAVRVGLSTFTSEQLEANVEATVTSIVDKCVPKKWKGVKSIHIKGPNTMALPVWLTQELWEEETQVLEEAEVDQARIDALPKKKRKKLLEIESAGTEDKKRAATDVIDDGAERKKRRKGGDDGMSKEMKERRERLRQQKQEIGEKLDSK